MKFYTALIIFISFFLETSAWAMAKKAPVVAPAEGKKGIFIRTINRTPIDLPDGSSRDFGTDFSSQIQKSLFDTQKYIITTDKPAPPQSTERFQALIPNPNEYVWNTSAPVSAEVEIKINAVRIHTGQRGSSRFFGVDDRMNSSFENEFPVRTDGKGENFFGHSFDAIEAGIYDSRTGLNLPNLFELNIFFASLSWAYEPETVDLDLTFNIFSPESNLSTSDSVKTQAKGALFSIGASYMGYSGDILVKRTQSVIDATQKALDSGLKTLDSKLGQFQRIVKLDELLTDTPDGTIALLGTGLNSQIPVGTLFHPLDSSEIVFQIIHVQEEGSVAKLIQGSANQIQSGIALTDGPVISKSFSALRAVSTTNSLSSTSPTAISSIIDFLALPYRIWRFYQYDQALKTPTAAASDSDFTIAVLDSGMDYNHDDLKNSIWTNEKPSTDLLGRKDLNGWDFISNDERPYDDGYHGTEVASLIHAMAANVKLLPLKVIDPYGNTRSSALFDAFKYAIDHKAKIIVCAWATEISSQALEQAIALAEKNQVWVVTSAGDESNDLEKSPRFPAALSAKYSNVISSLAVDSTHALLKSDTRTSNFSNRFVQLAVEMGEVQVATPRNHHIHIANSDLSAAIVAGSLAQFMQKQSMNSIEDYLAQTKTHEDLLPYVQKGRFIISNLK